MDSVEWRRNKVQGLASQGYNQSEISRILQISQATINRDIAYLRQQAKSPSKNMLLSTCQNNVKSVLVH